jgi:hypothetical protein
VKAGDRDEAQDDEDEDFGGISFWTTAHKAKPLDLIARDRVVIEGGRMEWHIDPVDGKDDEGPIESSDPANLRLIRRSYQRRLRIARRHAPSRAVPKPQSTTKRKPTAHAEVPCPLCRHNATRENPGEAWPDCECCGGDGIVSARQAQAWNEQHG